MGASDLGAPDLMLVSLEREDRTVPTLTPPAAIDADRRKRNSNSNSKLYFAVVVSLRSERKHRPRRGGRPGLACKKS